MSAHRESARGPARRRRVTIARALAVASMISITGCHAEPTGPEPVVVASAAAHCPSGPVPAAFAPGVDAELEQAAFWIPRVGEPGRVLLDATELAELRARDRGKPGFARDPWDVGPTSAQLVAEAAAMLDGWERERSDGEVVTAPPDAIVRARALLAAAQPTDHAKLVVTPSQLYCTPLDTALLRAPFDAAFDRNLCTALHPGELVRVLARADAGRWLLVDAGHTVGWVHPAGLSARLSERDRVAWRSGDRLWSLRDDVRTRGGVPVPLGVGLPVVAIDDAGIHVRIATADGPADDLIAPAAKVTVGFAPLRRDAVLELLFAQIGARYGWGGKDGGRDCSQLLRDALLPFGVALPRHSSLQAVAGTRTIDVIGMTATDKLAAIDRAARAGLVLLYMPGHIMLDLGEAGGRHWSISAISEYLEPCPDGTDTLFRLDRVAVTDLELGRGSARGAFIDRITTLAVLAPGTDE